MNFSNNNKKCTNEADIPARILNCKLISREINFTSSKEISDLRLRQRIEFHGKCIEEWIFDFGFVIPNSTNSWQQVIKAAGKRHMMSAEILSGNVLIETCFFDGVVPIEKSYVRINYT